MTVSSGSITVYGTTYGSGGWVRGLLLDSATNFKATGAGNINFTGMAPVNTVEVGYYSYNTTVSSNGGSISINGTACNLNAQAWDVYLDTSSCISTIGAGNVTIIGNMACSTTACSVGVRSLSSCVTTSNGMITIIGTSNSSVQGTRGFWDTQSNYTATGTGDISVSGTACGTYNVEGVYYQQSTMRTNSGTLTVRGTANAPINDYNHGIRITGGSGLGIGSFGPGNVNVTGLAYGVKMAYGVQLEAQGVIRANTGTITVNGTSYGTGTDEAIGVRMDYGACVAASGSGNVNIIGVTSGGASGNSVNSWGIHFNAQSYDTQARIYTNGGQVNISANSINMTLGRQDAISGGNVVVQTLGAAVNLGGADGPGNLGLTATELGWITANQLTIGSSTTGPIVNTAAISRSNATVGTNLSLVSGNSITQTGSGCLSISGAASFISTGTGSAGNVTLNNATNSFLGAVATTGAAVQIANASGSTLNKTSPASTSVSANQAATFTIAVSGNTTPAVQWQKQAPAGSWANITGANTTSYTTPLNTASDDGTKYRAVVTNPLGTLTTNPANLSVISVVMTLDTGGLEFRTDTGFQPAGSTYSVTGPVYLGYIPASGSSFYRLLELNGTVTVDTSALTFSATGAIKAAVFSPALTLVSGGISTGSLSDLINGKIAGLAGRP